jgi:tetratricopeptide (TPR) repeat protein
MRAAAAALLMVFALVAPAWAGAQTPDALYRAGQYDAAIAAGRAAGDANGYAEAARAELAKERLRDAPCLACLKRAESDARKAIAADPKAVMPRVLLAAALGYEARIIGTIEAKMKGYAGEAKDNLDAALKSDPNDPWALAAMGGWNIGVVNGGGSFLARMMYGATLKKGLAYYARAMAADPVGIPIRFQYALSLSAYDREDYAKQIGAALTFAATGTPRTSYETIMQGQARKLLALFRKGDWDGYDTLVHRYQGYPD